jgi:Protein of unknown function (DUF3467)
MATKTGGEQNRGQISVVVPDNVSALYSDLVIISSNEFGLLLDFAQSVGNANQKKVVARIGMSKEHAIALLNALNERLKNTLKIAGSKN